MADLIFQNYHKHSYWSNIKVSDSATSLEEYCKRAVELGHGIISSLEHGWQGHYIECHQLAAKYNLKFLFGVEAYWVKDRFYVDENGRKDGANCHICLLAMNENGRQAINEILSQAAEDCYFKDTFYRQTRIDLPLIMSLPENDVVVTTACLAFHKYEDIDEIILSLANKFKNNFFLEVQYHNTIAQKKLNQHILDLKNEHNLQLIMGCDSHYIDEQGKEDRIEFIKSKRGDENKSFDSKKEKLEKDLARGKISQQEYDESIDNLIKEMSEKSDLSDENDWYMDYPDGQTAYNRFAEQCVLSHDEIMEAINNTNIFLNVEEYDSIIFNHDVKMPTLYPDLTQEEKDKKYEDLIWSAWEEYKKEVPEELWDHYIEEISGEIQTVKDTFHADYFLLDNAIVNKAKEYGGVLTQSGRGSSVSNVTNMLAGFTNVDRVSAKVKMYPERFMSTTRILETHSLADIDMNCPEQEPFWKAQEEVIGFEHSKQMVAFGLLKPSAAWKMYAKAQGIDFEISNKISEFIKKWQKDVAHAEEDEVDDIDIMDYIPEEYQDIYNASEKYQGIVSSISPHPCASLIFAEDIRKQIGYIYVKSKTGKATLACCMDGKWAEKYGFLKNDWLKVNVYKSIYDTFKRAGAKVLSVNELLKECTPDNKVWDIYKNQCTMGINQIEKVGTASRAAKYKPTNISELTAFVAAIRPGFKTMYKKFESREPFSYNIPSFDNLIQTEEMPNSFVLYQEQVMATLHYAGIPMSECYGVIKSISKKRHEEVYKYKDVFSKNFAQKLVENENKTQEEADELTNQIWKIIEANAYYSFNCLSGDTLIFGHKHTLKEMYENNERGIAISHIDKNEYTSNNILDVVYKGIKNVYKLTTKLGNKIECTKDHKFITPNGDIPLSNLRQGDELFNLIDGVDIVDTIEYVGEKPVYDVEMEDPYHNFVLANGLCVHNCSHAYCVAIDSLYGAYLKTYYPLEFYEVYLNILNDKGDKDRLNKFKEEAESYFNIVFPPYIFGQDNRRITIDKEHNAIVNALSSIKGYSDIIGELLYQCSQECSDFISILKWLNEYSVKSAKIIPLIKIGYFRNFGNTNSLLTFVDIFDKLKQGDAKEIKKDSIDGWFGDIIAKYSDGDKKDGTAAKSWKLVNIDKILEESYNYCINNFEEMPYSERMKNQQDILGYIELTTNNPEDLKKVLILDVVPLKSKFAKNEDEVWAYKIETRSIGTGRTASLNVKTATWKKYGALDKMDIIQVGTIGKNNKDYWYIYDYKIIHKYK